MQNSNLKFQTVKRTYLGMLGVVFLEAVSDVIVYYDIKVRRIVEELQNVHLIFSVSEIALP
ncbi:hypothetical protein T08_4026 [Trichinella sp. T8]|nr:hypothetical protein T08_4026 [Trichinella sp. T8]